MTDRLTVLVAARDEEGRIAQTVEGLRSQFPEALIVVADDGSRDATAERAEEAGARVILLARRGKGQALTLAERELEPGPILLSSSRAATRTVSRSGDRSLAGSFTPAVGRR